MQYAWLIWSIFLLAIWAIVYLTLKTKESKKEMLTVSLWTSIMGLTEPLFVPEYWNPPSLFNLAEKTGFDIESIIFAFGIGGLAVVLYEYTSFKKVKHTKISQKEKMSPRHRFHILALLAAPSIFALLLFATKLNPIYSTIIALTGGGIASWYCRPDLKKKMIIGAFIFSGIYFLFFLTLIAVYPDYVSLVWNMESISNILILGVPIEEIAFAWSFGFMWASTYEHIYWKKIL